MAERVGDVRDARGAPELAGAAEPLLQVADDRFAGNEKEVGEDVPRTDEQAIGSDERFDPGAIGRTLLEIVLDRDRLSVERERTEVGIALEAVEQVRHPRDEPRAVSLEPFV